MKLDDSGNWKIVSFKQFDARHTAPIHGFKDAWEYLQKCSCINWLDKLTVSALLVTSLDDPLLSRSY